MTLKTYGSRFLDARDSAGVRDIKNERSRWRHHCETAHFAEWPIQNVEKSDAKEWLANLGQKFAINIRAAERGACQEGLSSQGAKAQSADAQALPQSHAHVMGPSD